MSDHAPSVAAPADPLLEAWRQYTIRFATEPEVRNSETSIRDAFAAGWDAAALRAESVAAPLELREAATRYVEDVEAGKDPRPTWQSLREAVRAARHAPPALDAAPDRRYGQIVLLDVDGVLSDGRPWRRATARPGVQLLLDTLACLGFQLIAWSAGGAEYAQRVCESLTLHGAIWRYAEKPAYPMTEEAAIAAVGFRPVLQIDDDPTERVADWEFMEWPTFTGPHRIAGAATPASGEPARPATVGPMMHGQVGFPGFDHVAGTEPERCEMCREDAAAPDAPREGGESR